MERPDGQPVRDPRVREGWVERRYLRTEQSVIDENARRQRADEERRAVEQQAEQHMGDQGDRDIHQAQRDAQGRLNALDPRRLYYWFQDRMRGW